MHSATRSRNVLQSIRPSTAPVTASVSVVRFGAFNYSLIYAYIELIGTSLISFWHGNCMINLPTGFVRWLMIISYLQSINLKTGRGFLSLRGRWDVGIGASYLSRQ
jgi:hypothetical protein